MTEQEATEQILHLVELSVKGSVTDKDVHGFFLLNSGVQHGGLAMRAWRALHEALKEMARRVATPPDPPDPQGPAKLVVDQRAFQSVLQGFGRATTDAFRGEGVACDVCCQFTPGSTMPRQHGAGCPVRALANLVPPTHLVMECRWCHAQIPTGLDPCPRCGLNQLRG